MKYAAAGYKNVGGLMRYVQNVPKPQRTHPNWPKLILWKGKTFSIVKMYLQYICSFNI